MKISRTPQRLVPLCSTRDSAFQSGKWRMPSAYRFAYERASLSWVLAHWRPMTACFHWSHVNSASGGDVILCPCVWDLLVFVHKLKVKRLRRDCLNVYLGWLHYSPIHSKLLCNGFEKRYIWVYIEDDSTCPTQPHSVQTDTMQLSGVAERHKNFFHKTGYMFASAKKSKKPRLLKMCWILSDCVR